MLAQFAEEGYPAAEVQMHSSVDVRFKGQTSEILVAVEGDRFTEAALQSLCTTFVAEHERLYGHRSDPDSPIEVVAVRLVGEAAALQEVSDRVLLRAKLREEADELAQAASPGEVAAEAADLVYFAVMIGSFLLLTKAAVESVRWR